MSYFQDIVEFHKAIGAPDPAIGDFSQARVELRMRLIQEEFDELMEAINNEDFVEIADGIADLVVVTLGTAAEYGFPFEEIWAEVHRSNMAKAGGEVREDGKALKPEGWKPPNLYGILWDAAKDNAERLRTK